MDITYIWYKCLILHKTNLEYIDSIISSILWRLLMATSRPDIVQIVGRIMRVEKDKRTIQPLIIDIVDVPFRRQFGERLKLYKDRGYQIQKMKI